MPCKLGASAALAFALIAWPYASTADQPCVPIIPEVAEEVAGPDLPREETRWQVVGRLWSASGRYVSRAVDQSLATGSFAQAADLIQGYTNDALREAIRTGRDGLAEEMLELWRKPFSTLQMRDRYLAYYLTPGQPVSEARLDGPEEMWVEPSGVEAELYPAIYLAGATDVALAIAQRSPGERTEAMTRFSRRIARLAVSHYKRWSFGPPHTWQVRGWGCDASGLDLVEFTRRRMDRSLGNGRAAYCVAPTDLDMLLVIGISNLLQTAEIAPELVPLTPHDRERFGSLLRLQAQFMASRLAWGTAVDARGRTVTVVDFDPGSWARHPDWSHAADEELRFPTSKPSPKDGVGRDISHGWRIAWMALTLASHPQAVAGTADWSAVVDALARQVAAKVLDTTASVPRFRNYLDGSNGWYRVDYSGRKGFGYPPYGLSRTFLESPWARLAVHDERLLAATAQMWKVLAAPSEDACRDFNQTYVSGHFWRDRKPFARPFASPSGSLSLLPFAAVSPVR